MRTYDMFKPRLLKLFIGSLLLSGCATFNPPCDGLPQRNVKYLVTKGFYSGCYWEARDADFNGLMRCEDYTIGYRSSCKELMDWGVNPILE